MIHYAIDSIVEQNNCIKVCGWAFAEDHSHIKLMCNRKFSQKTISRYDVQAVFSEMDIKETCGFELEIIKRRLFNKKPIVLTISSLTDHIEVPVNVQSNINEEEINEYIALSYRPLISIVIPVFNTPIHYFNELLTSIYEQSYDNWELCLADGGSDSVDFVSYLKQLAQKDTRIHLTVLEENLGISDNTNAAIRMAKGEYIAFCDHDDVLHKDALYEVVKLLNEHNDADLIYTDEDKITMDSKLHFQPNRKSDFNMKLLEVGNYINHLTVVRANVLENIGYLHKEFDGSQDYDVVLRISEKTDHFYHIPKVLYHWRCHEESVASSPEAKLYAFDRAVQALQEHFNRIGRSVLVEKGDIYGSYKVIDKDVAE